MQMCTECPTKGLFLSVALLHDAVLTRSISAPIVLLFPMFKLG